MRIRRERASDRTVEHFDGASTRVLGGSRNFGGRSSKRKAWKAKVAEPMSLEGLITIPSDNGPKVTMDRLDAEVKAKGLTVFARVDHAAGAAKVGMTLRPTELLIFGNAKGGTPLMQSNQTSGIDLPLKALVWQDASGQTWLSYNDPGWLTKRHGLGSDVAAAVSAMAGLLGAVSKSATTRA
jgi:uncharacterized protein (DUF302 family)